MPLYSSPPLTSPRSDYVLDSTPTPAPALPSHPINLHNERFVVEATKEGKLFSNVTETSFCDWFLLKEHYFVTNTCL